MKLPALSANPQVYDYIHDLRFRDNGTVELADGAGQRLTTLVHGRYAAHRSSDETIEIMFDRLIEVNPYDRPRPTATEAGNTPLERTPTGHLPKLRDIPSFAARCTRQEGRFVFHDPEVWGVADEDERPYLLFTARYVFDADPLAFGESQQRNNLYYQVESARHLDQLHAAEHIYYAHGTAQRLPWRELATLGLTKTDVLG